MRAYTLTPGVGPFNIGDDVCLSELGRLRCPKMDPRPGKVIGFSSRTAAVRVLFEGRRSAAILHPSYLELRREAGHSRPTSTRSPVDQGGSVDSTGCSDRPNA